MNANEIVTKQDLNDALEKTYLKIILKINTMIQNDKNVKATQTRFLKTSDVRKMTGLSLNTIKEMRRRNEIPWKQVGKIFLYPEKELLEKFNPDKFNPKV